MPTGVIVKTFNEHPINAAPYETVIERGQGMGDIYTAQVVEVEIPGRFASFIRSQPKSKDFTLNIYMHAGLGTGLSRELAEKILYGWFDPANGPGILKVASPGNGDLVMEVLPVKLTVSSPGHYAIGMHAAVPVWESVDAETASESVTVSGQTLTVNQGGNTVAYPTITLTPTALKPNTAYWTKRKRITLANRSEFALGDPANPDGYPVVFDISSLLAYDPSQIRVFLNGRQLPRWITGDGTKMWVNMRMRGRIVGTLAADIDSNVTELTINNVDGFAAWPQGRGFFLIDNECIKYEELGIFTAYNLTRGDNSTNAASHNAGSTLYWVEHPFLDIMYDFPTASASFPLSTIELADRKPLIDLDASSNIKHVWAGPFINSTTTRRSRAFELLFSDDSVSAHNLRVYNAPFTDALTFEDALPVVGKPAYNNAELKFPVPIRASTTALSFAYAVGKSLALQVYATDLDGNESRVTAQFGTAPITPVFSLGNPATSLRFNALISTVSGDLDLNGTLDIIGVDGVMISEIIDNPIFEDAMGAWSYLAFGFDGGAFTSPDPDNGKPRKFRLDTFLTPFIHFALNGDTVVDGFAAGASFNQGFSIYKGSADTPGDFVAFGQFGPDGVCRYNPPLNLPGGDYWCNITLNTGFLSRFSRTNASLYWGYHPISSLHETVRWERINPDPTVVYTDYPDGKIYHRNTFTMSPVFAVLSKETPPQADAPTATGNIISVDTLTVELDIDRAPKIVQGAEEAVYAVSARIRNETTGDFLDIFFPTALTESVVIDCKHRTITDSVTGEPILFSLVSSNPDDWIFLVPGNNVISYTEDGVVATTLSLEWFKTLL